MCVEGRGKIAGMHVCEYVSETMIQERKLWLCLCVRSKYIAESIVMEEKLGLCVRV